MGLSMNTKTGAPNASVVPLIVNGMVLVGSGIVVSMVTTSNALTVIAKL